MKSTDNSFEQKPDTYKSPGSDTYIVFGEAKIEDLSQQVIIHLDPILEISLDQNLRFTYLYLHRVTQTGFKSQIPKTEFSRENPKKLKY